MTIDEATKEAFKRYQKILIEKGYKSEDNSAEFQGRYKQLNHALHMCNYILSDKAKYFSIDKMSRWLGFVQCTLIMNGITTINAERDITRPWFSRLGNDND